MDSQEELNREIFALESSFIEESTLLKGEVRSLNSQLVRSRIQDDRKLFLIKKQSKKIDKLKKTSAEAVEKWQALYDQTNGELNKALQDCSIKDKQLEDCAAIIARLHATIDEKEKLYEKSQEDWKIKLRKTEDFYKKLKTSFIQVQGNDEINEYLTEKLKTMREKYAKSKGELAILEKNIDELKEHENRYKTLEKKNIELLEAYRLLKNDHDSLQSSHNTLLSKLEELDFYSRTLYHENVELKEMKECLVNINRTPFGEDIPILYTFSLEELYSKYVKLVLILKFFNKQKENEIEILKEKHRNEIAHLQADIDKLNDKEIVNKIRSEKKYNVIVNPAPEETSTTNYTYKENFELLQKEHSLLITNHQTSQLEIQRLSNENLELSRILAESHMKLQKQLPQQDNVRNMTQNVLNLQNRLEKYQENINELFKLVTVKDNEISLLQYSHRQETNTLSAEKNQIYSKLQETRQELENTHLKFTEEMTILKADLENYRACIFNSGNERATAEFYGTQKRISGLREIIDKLEKEKEDFKNVVAQLKEVKKYKEIAMMSHEEIDKLGTIIKELKHSVLQHENITKQSEDFNTSIQDIIQSKDKEIQYLKIQFDEQMLLKEQEHLQVKANFEKYKEDIKKLEQSKQDMIKNKKESNKKLKDLQAEIETLNAEIEHLRRITKDMNTEIETLNKRLEDVNVETDSKELEELQNINHKLEEEIKTAREERERAQRALKNKEDEISFFLSSRTGTDQEIQNLRKELTEAQEDSRTCNRNLELAQKRIQELQNYQPDPDNPQNASREELPSNEQEMALEEAINNPEREISQKEQELAQKEQELSSREEEIAKREHESSKKEQEIAKKELEYRNWDENLKNRTASVSQEEAKNTKEREENNKRTNFLDKKHEELVKREENLRNRTGQSTEETSKVESDELRRTNRFLKEENADLNKKLEEANNKARRFKEQGETLRAALARRRSDRSPEVLIQLVSLIHQLTVLSDY